MTGPRIASVCFFLLTLLLSLGVHSLVACEIPPALLTGRSLPETWKILEGEVVFVADAQLHDFEGRTRAISGLVMARELADAVGCVAIEAKDVDTGIRRRNEIMWKDHLEVTAYPEIRFTLTGLTDVRKEAERVRLMLQGELILHGVPHSLRIPATVSSKDGMFEVEGKTTLKMSDHAIERPSFLFFTVKDEVDVWFKVLVGKAT
jgi:polyisoprenoid-binding protein YceI